MIYSLRRGIRVAARDVKFFDFRVSLLSLYTIIDERMKIRCFFFKFILSLSLTSRIKIAIGELRKINEEQSME